MTRALLILLASCSYSTVGTLARDAADDADGIATLDGAPVGDELAAGPDAARVDAGACTPLSQGALDCAGTTVPLPRAFCSEVIPQAGPATVTVLQTPAACLCAETYHCRCVLEAGAPVCADAASHVTGCTESLASGGTGVVVTCE